LINNWLMNETGTLKLCWVYHSSCWVWLCGDPTYGPLHRGRSVWTRPVGLPTWSRPHWQDRLGVPAGTATTGFALMSRRPLDRPSSLPRFSAPMASGFWGRCRVSNKGSPGSTRMGAIPDWRMSFSWPWLPESPPLPALDPVVGCFLKSLLPLLSHN